MNKVALLILDGWGHGKSEKSNAIKNAKPLLLIVYIIYIQMVS